MANEAQNINQNKNISPIKQSGPQVLMPARRITPFEEMDQLLESFFPRSWVHPLRREWPSFNDGGSAVRAPRIDIINRDEDILVRAEVPGVNKDDLDISLTENTITIQGSSDRPIVRRKKKREITIAARFPAVLFPEASCYQVM